MDIFAKIEREVVLSEKEEEKVEEEEVRVAAKNMLHVNAMVKQAKEKRRLQRLDKMSHPINKHIDYLHERPATSDHSGKRLTFMMSTPEVAARNAAEEMVNSSLSQAQSHKRSSTVQDSSRPMTEQGPRRSQSQAGLHTGRNVQTVAPLNYDARVNSHLEAQAVDQLLEDYQSEIHDMRDAVADCI